uniref:Uncharacterized protein n=1 Tax=Hordeum vulgare subsp. vulgare TaxID=112509 RepID=A0A8I6Y1J8_HORVV
MSSVERAMAKTAASLLPGLLPIPPTRPCLIILPASFASKTMPGRADSVERWDAHKKDKKPKTPASSCCSSCTSSSSSSRRSSTSRASSCGRWDINKTLTASRASSAARWDTHKKLRSEQAAAKSWTGNKEDQEDKWTTQRRWF